MELHSPKNAGIWETVSRNVFVSIALSGGSSQNWFSIKSDMILPYELGELGEEQRQRAALGWEKPGTMFLWWVGKRNRPLSLFTNRWEIIHEPGENTRYVHNTHTNKTRRKDEVWMTLLYLRQGLIWTTDRAGSKLQGVKWRFWLQGGSNWIRAL